jgi:hypothetical protein
VLQLLGEVLDDDDFFFMDRGALFKVFDHEVAVAIGMDIIYCACMVKKLSRGLTSVIPSFRIA